MEKLVAIRGLKIGIKEKVDAAKGWADAGGAVAKAYTVASSYVAPLMIAHQVAGG